MRIRRTDEGERGGGLKRFASRVCKGSSEVGCPSFNDFSGFVAVDEGVTTFSSDMGEGLWEDVIVLLILCYRSHFKGAKGSINMASDIF